jgi:hypothetical protein
VRTPLQHPRTLHSSPDHAAAGSFSRDWPTLLDSPHLWEHLAYWQTPSLISHLERRTGSRSCPDRSSVFSRVHQGQKGRRVQRACAWYRPARRATQPPAPSTAASVRSSLHACGAHSPSAVAPPAPHAPLTAAQGCSSPGMHSIRGDFPGTVAAFPCSANAHLAALSSCKSDVLAKLPLHKRCALQEDTQALPTCPCARPSQQGTLHYSRSRGCRPPVHRCPRCP